MNIFRSVCLGVLIRFSGFCGISEVNRQGNIHFQNVKSIYPVAIRIQQNHVLKYISYSQALPACFFPFGLYIVQRSPFNVLFQPSANSYIFLHASVFPSFPPLSLTRNSPILCLATSVLFDFFSTYPFPRVFVLMSVNQNRICLFEISDMEIKPNAKVF